MNVDDFRKMYVAELQELRSVEDQLVEALPRMAALVEHPQLRRALEAHLSETKSQRDRLDRLLRAHDAGNREHEDGSMHAIIREAERWAKMVSDRDCRDAGIVASAQRVEHYEIAVYGTLATWAKQLGLREDERVLHDILQEEKRADEKLSQLAERDLNREAAEHIQSTTYARQTASPPAYYLREGSRAVGHQVEDNPFVSIAFAGAVGYLLAYAIHGTERPSSRGAPTRNYAPRGVSPPHGGL